MLEIAKLIGLYVLLLIVCIGVLTVIGAVIAIPLKVMYLILAW